MTGHPIALAVMTRAPSDESGKTRLLAELGISNGLELRRAILLDTLDVARRVTAVQPVLVFTPAAAQAELSELAGGGWTLIPQRGDDLGERLELAFADLFAAGFPGALIIGSDLPTLPAEFLRLAAAQLMALDDAVVLGPARDGGYYLVGLRNAHPELFRGVAWSTAAVLSETIGIARGAGLQVSFVPEWYDVDSLEDLRRAAAQSHHAPRTRGVFARLGEPTL